MSDKTATINDFC